VNSKRPGPLP